MQIQTIKAKYNCITFKQRIEIGDTTKNYSETNPTAFYFDKFAKAEIPEKKLTNDDITKLHQAIKAYIGVLQPIMGPLDPTLENHESSFTIEKNCHTPAAIDPEIESKNLQMEDEVEAKFKIASPLLEEKEAKVLDILHSKIMSTEKSSSEYVDRIIEMNQFMAKGMNMEVNIENGVLDDIAKSNDSTVFLINHYWAPYDSGLGQGTIAELYKSYKKNNIKNFPEPKYLINKSTLENMPLKMKESLKATQAVGVAAPSYPTEWSAKYNKYTMPNVIKGFLKNENHIIIHPEGRRSLYTKDLPLEERFQDGIAKIVQMAVEKKGRVRVVSIGTDYHDGLGVSHIGTPMYFEKHGDTIKVTHGSITADTEAAQNNNFYKKLAISADEGLTICHKGIP